MTNRPPVFLHIGAPKSGTTYVQSKLWHNRDALRADGFRYPGDDPRAHFWAMSDLRGMVKHGHAEPEIDGAWKRTVEELRTSAGPGIIDNELLAGARPPDVDRAVQDLDWAEVHVIYTLRDMARTLPAAWQERAKTQRTESFGEFLDQVRPAEGKTRSKHGFWRLHDAATILPKWSATLPPERVHVVTLPQRGADPAALWRRFATALGIDPDRYVEPPAGDNASLPAPAATLLRRVNEAIGGKDYPWAIYEPVVKRYLAAGLAGRPGPPIALPAEHFDWATQWCERVIDFICAAGYDVVGDLDELRPVAVSDGIDPDQASPQDQADAAVDAVALLLRYLADHGGATGE